MEVKRFYGIMGNASKFLTELTIVESKEHGWTEKYIHFQTGNYWLKYMVDRDNGRYYNLMLLTPKPTTEEMINIAFQSADHDEVEGAVHRLLFEEEVEGKVFRSALFRQLKEIDIPRLDQAEKARIKTIIYNAHLTDPTNKAETLGKSLTEIQNDAVTFKEFANYASQILTQLQ